MKRNQKSRAKRVWNVISVAITVLLMIVALVTLIAVTSARAGGKPPSLFGYTFSIVITDSMTPEINVDDLVIAKKCNNSEIAVGDDIVFVSADPVLKGNKVVHRVVGINLDGSFVTQGIKEGARPDKCAVTETVGKVVAVNTFFGKALKFMTENKNIIFLLLILTVVVVAIVEIAGLLIKKKTPEKEEQ